MWITLALVRAVFSLLKVTRPDGTSTCSHVNCLRRVWRVCGWFLLTAVLFFMNPYNPKGLYVCLTVAVLRQSALEQPVRQNHVNSSLFWLVKLYCKGKLKMLLFSSCSHLHQSFITFVFMISLRHVETAMSETSGSCVLVEGFYSQTLKPKIKRQRDEQSRWSTEFYFESVQTGNPKWTDRLWCLFYVFFNLLSSVSALICSAGCTRDALWTTWPGGVAWIEARVTWSDNVFCSSLSHGISGQSDKLNNHRSRSDRLWRIISNSQWERASWEEPPIRC